MERVVPKRVRMSLGEGEGEGEVSAEFSSLA